MKKRIAVLALQGAFVEHEHMLESLGVNVFEVRNLDDWCQPKDGVVIPGGESTAIGRILSDEGLLQPIRQEIEAGLPAFGTCAGMILLAKDVAESDGSNSNHHRLMTMDIAVKRNAYGRQLGSFNHVASVKGLLPDFPMTFIRAPYIQSVGDGVEVLAQVDGKIVAARQGKQLVCAFHPELTDDTRIHQMWLSMI